MNHMDHAARTAAYLQTFVEKEGFVLLKTEYVREDGVNYLRAYIDLTEKEREKRRNAALEQKAQADASDLREEDTNVAQEEDADEVQEENSEPGIGINDCALVSRRLSKWLDKEDFISEEYILEVCSRGYLN